MQLNETVTGKVTRVVDGDSIYVGDKKLRLWGVDAPEENDFGYEEAKSTLRNVVLNKTVTCTCRDIDRHGRSIVMCQLENGHDVGEILVRSGWALDYRKHTHGYYEKAEDTAKATGLGLWAPR